MIRHAVLVISACALGAGRLAVADDTTPGADPIAGCYELRWGPWQPPLRDTGWVPPPSRIELVTERAPQPFMKGSFLVRFQEGSKQLPWYAEWKPTDRRKIDFVWMTSHSGIFMSLEAESDRLSGQAKTIPEYRKLKPQSASVVAVRVPCK